MYVVGYFHGDRLFVFCSHITVKEGKVLDIGTGPKQHGITNVSRFFFSFIIHRANFQTNRQNIPTCISLTVQL